ncbi:MAG: hypothetical protein ACOCWG_04505 [bacterium]
MDQKLYECLSGENFESCFDGRVDVARVFISHIYDCFKKRSKLDSKMNLKDFGYVSLSVPMVIEEIRDNYSEEGLPDYSELCRLGEFITLTHKCLDFLVSEKFAEKRESANVSYKVANSNFPKP